MNSSDDFSITSDWDIIDEENVKVIPSRMESEEATSEDLEERVQKGSCVADILPEQELVQEDSNLPEMTGSEVSNHCGSSSSSEFDVLDETVEDNHNNLSSSHMEYSISSSLESNHPSMVPEEAEVESDLQEETSEVRQYNGYNINVHPFLIAVVISLAMLALLLAPFGSMLEMKERINALQTENDDLKNMVQSKLENDKVLMALEEQIKSLKDENFKLSESMKALVAQLEEQTIILKNDKEGKMQDPYRMEIEKLKEQINILQIDNEDLQNQLVRTRYGIYSPHPKATEANPAGGDKKEPKDKTDSKENRENSSDILMEEISELRKKLYSEVEKLKNWKDSVQHLVRKLENGYTGSSRVNEKEILNNKKSSSEWAKESKFGKKAKKCSDWSWGGLKKNLKDRFEDLQGIDVSDIISNYVGRKKIEGVFESVGHYFKKAQEKTKKALNFNNDINEEMQNFLRQVRDHWSDVKNKYFQENYQDLKLKSKMHNRENTHNFENGKKFDKYEKKTKQNEASDEKEQKLYPDLQSFVASPSVETPNFENNELPTEDKEMHGDNSWVFKRAAHRSQLREEEQEAFTNWFLKRGKDFHYNEDESFKEWFKETYQNRDLEDE